VVPILVEPAFEQLFELGKIDHSANGVDLVAGHVKIGRVIVAVKILALAAVFMQAMAGAKLDPPHDRKAHDENPDSG
jgi:hypothetical protein